MIHHLVAIRKIAFIVLRTFRVPFLKGDSFFMEKFERCFFKFINLGIFFFRESGSCFLNRRGTEERVYLFKIFVSNEIVV